MTFMLTRYLHLPFELTLTQFRAKAIDIAGPRLHHTEPSKLYVSPDIGPRSVVNLKALSMLWGGLAESFRTPPRVARYDHCFSR